MSILRSDRELFSSEASKPLMELFSFKHKQWVLIAVTILIILPLTMAGTFYREVRTTFLRKFFVPGLEASFGYKTESRRLYYGEQPLDVYVVSFLESDGRMAAAGLRVNDVPMELFHMNDVDLADKLLATDDSETELKVMEIRFYEELLRQDLGGPMWEKQRELIIASDKERKKARSFLNGLSRI